jgi:predicted nucleic acid-binding protein
VKYVLDTNIVLYLLGGRLALSLGAVLLSCDERLSRIPEINCRKPILKK